MQIISDVSFTKRKTAITSDNTPTKEFMYYCRSGYYLTSITQGH